MNIETALITPEIARKFLDKNTANRSLSDSRIAALARSMQHGEWEFTGDAIRFSDQGTLLDGQHRLAAVIKSGVPIQTLVITGLPNRVFDVIDRGAARTPGDVLSIKGETNYNALAAALRMLFLWRETGNPCNTTRELQPSIREIEQCLSENPDLRIWTNRATRSRWIRGGLSPSVGAFCLYVFSRSTLSDHLEGFISTLEEGITTRIGDPAIALNRALMEDRGAKRKMSKPYKVALTFKAFRRYAAGDVARSLRVRTEGPKRERNIFYLPMDERGIRSPLEEA